MNRLIDLGSQLTKSRSENEFRKAIESAADFVGASVYNALAFASDEPGTDGKGTDNLPSHLDMNEVAHEWHLWDPVMQHCRMNSSPMIWDQSTYVEAELPHLWEYMASYGIRQGASLALHLGEHRHFCLGFTWNRSRPLSQDEQVEAALCIQALAVFAEPAAFQLWHPTSPRQSTETAHPLSRRERECLYWVSRGMTDDLISRLLKISARTVRKHVDNSVLKLSAANRTEAAVTATRLGLLADVGIES